MQTVVANLPLELGRFKKQLSKESNILYALSVGSTVKHEMHFLYENHSQFQPVPSYSAAYFTDFMAILSSLKKYVGTLNPASLVHGEQQLELHVPTLPIEGTITQVLTLRELWDKGNSGALIVVSAEAYHGPTLVATNTMRMMYIGGGNFGGERGPKAKLPRAPKSQPLCTYTQKTSTEQAALYRLNGDDNPLHIDPAMAKFANMKAPILHGLCTMGYAVRHVLASFKEKVGTNVVPTLGEVRCRFAAPVYLGDWLVTRMWKQEDGCVLFSVIALPADTPPEQVEAANPTGTEVVVGFVGFLYETELARPLARL